MPNYKKMYFKLFNEISDIVERLRQVQEETEEMYISEKPVELRGLEHAEE